MASSSRLTRSALDALVKNGRRAADSSSFGEASTSYRSVVQTQRISSSSSSRACRLCGDLRAQTSDGRSSQSFVRKVSSRQFSSTARHSSAWPAGTDAQQRASGSSVTSERSLPPSEKAVTVRDIADLKERGEPIAVLTAYDYSSGLSQRAAAVDICLVGDSLANVALGHRTTHALTLDAMIHHCQAVARGLRHPTLNAHDVPPVPLMIADMPYGCGVEASIPDAVHAATRLVKEGGADGVKIEGGMEVVPLIKRLTSFGIPVMAHIGLQPQRASSGSALNLASRTADEAVAVLETAHVLEHSGAFSAVLEAVPARVGAAISQRMKTMAIIGIGAGNGTDGQVLVADDVLGECSSPMHVLADLRGFHVDKSKATVGAEPSSIPQALQPLGARFVRNFAAEVTGGASIGAIRIKAVQAYVAAVKARTFPDNDVEGYKMKREEWAKLKGLLGM